jgi:hypothetical protein
MMHNYEVLLESIMVDLLADPASPKSIEQLNMVNDRERRQLLSEYNALRSTPQPTIDLVQLLSRLAEQSGQNIAVQSSEASLDHQQLDYQQLE